MYAVGCVLFVLHLKSSSLDFIIIIIIIIIVITLFPQIRKAPFFL